MSNQKKYLDLSGLQNFASSLLNKFALKNHNHDEAYSKKVHTHEIANVNGLQSALDEVRDGIVSHGVISSGDLNTFTDVGTYKIDNGGNIRNFPPGAYAWGVLTVDSADKEGRNVVQTYTAHQGNNNAGQFFRCNYDGAWRQWQRQAFDGHTHQIANVNGLQGALNGKANTNHTHTKSQITDFPNIPSKTSQLTNDSGFTNTKITIVRW